ncbi:MAP kinase-activated protein kinase 5 isoform X2 [Oopsacas minuta]|uniref:MAP kinase-activated protein kinase 5 isoform X2 n=1 Tax=Oopsacas minuta TaxID=111878 RepID=A0AAV7KJ31_9METZ|nr:MAP kinase-activated protein kinase 5 isoform X2 [Oopsacas minuta]
MDTYIIKEHSFYEDYTMCDESLGTGITGEVRVCTDKGLTRYAVKILPDCEVYRKEAYTQWLCGAIDNVVEVVDVYSNEVGDDNTPILFLVMELMDKGDLYDLLSQGVLSEDDTKEKLAQIIQGLRHLHFHDISHRDLKPENILIKSSPFWSDTVKLADFGYAEDESQKMTEALYTFYYVAPEVLINDPNFNESVLIDGPKPYDKRCDLYSLGVIAYIMLMGYPPFLLKGSKEMNSEIYDSIINGHVFYYKSDWEKYSSNAKDFVFSLLQVNPDDRPSPKELMNHPWLCPKASWEPVEW